MEDNNWGLSGTGFKRPKYSDILLQLEINARELFGEKAQLHSNTLLGMFLRILAWISDKIFQLTEIVYNSRFVDTAEGLSLYNLGAMIGIRRLSAEKATGYATFTGEPFSVVPDGLMVGTVSGIQYTVQVGGELNYDGKGTFPIMCTVEGDLGNVDANRITQIVNPLSNLKSVTNELDISSGRFDETDEEFRDRYYLSIDKAGGVNVDSIRGAILQEVTGAVSCLVYENVTDFYDEKGLPPHSVSAIVHGGNDAEIAKTLFKWVGGGIQTYGNTEVIVISLSDQAMPIQFSRPKPVYIEIKVENLIVDKNFPNNGYEMIKKSLIDYIGDDEVGGINVGEDIIYNRIPCRVVNVPGVIDADIYVKTSSQSEWHKNNIHVDSYEKAMTGEQLIEITGQRM